jgi:hypothetical protein
VIKYIGKAMQAANWPIPNGDSNATKLAKTLLSLILILIVIAPRTYKKDAGKKKMRYQAKLILRTGIEPVALACCLEKLHGKLRCYHYTIVVVILAVNEPFTVSSTLAGLA